MNNSTEQKDWTVWLRTQQRMIVNLLFSFVLISGFVGLLASVLRTLIEKESSFPLVYYIITYLVVLALFTIRRIPDSWRALGFTAILYGFGILSLYSGWLSGGGRTFLLALVVVTAVLVSPRAGILAALISLITYILFGLAFVQGWLQLRPLPDPVSAPPVVVEGVGFTMATGMVILGLWFFGKALMAADQANHDLQASRASFHSIVEVSADSVVVVDLDGRIQFSNQAANALLGQGAGNLIGQAAKFPLHIGAPMEISMQTGRHDRVMELRVDDTSWEGQPARLATFREITERKLSEQNLRASEERMRALLHAIPDTIFVLDSRGKYLQVIKSKGTQPVLPAEKLIGLNLSEVMPPQIAQKAMQVIHNALQTGEIQSMEYQLAGGQGPEEFEARIIASGKDVVLAIVRDITEKKRVETQLSISEKKYREFVEQSSEGIWLLEFDDAIPIDLPAEEQVQRIQQTGFVAECNQAFAEMYGYEDYSSIPGKRLLDLYGSPEAAQKNYQVTLQLVRSGYRGNDRETIEMDRFGKRLYFMNNAAGVVQNGNLIGIWGTQRDITSLKQAEMEREALIQELSTKNAELERFAYTVSHDLRSPLVTIQGFAGYLQEDVHSGNTERLQGDVERIVRAAEKMQSLLNELLELSRIGRLINPPESVPFGRIVSEALDLMEGQLTAARAEVQVEPDMPVVLGDRPRLVEVVQNLLDNAIKFTKPQEAPHIKIGTHLLESGELVFLIRDNGIGIAPQYHERIFRLFDKLDSNTPGTGVGLALVKRIVDIHNGKIWVESDGKGNGSTFYFTLPVKLA